MNNILDYDLEYDEDDKLTQSPPKPRKRAAKQNTARLFSDDGKEQVRRNHSRRFH